MSARPRLRKADYNEGHPASLPIADDLVLREPDVFKDPSGFCSGTSLNAAEIEHFKINGFIVKRGLIDEPKAFAKVIQHIWSHVPRALMRKDDPKTWIEPPQAQWTEADASRVGLLARNNWKMRSKGATGIGTESFLVDNIANHSNMLQVVQSLIGSPVQSVRRVRGIYCVFPARPGSSERYSPHVDYMAAHLAAMVIATDIAPRCGGFMLWPGSHLRLHGYWQSVHGGMMSADNAEAFRHAREQVLRDTTPVEFTGRRGDVIFWHPRALHSAGINHSAEQDKPMLRVIVPCDYQRAGRSFFDDTTYGPGSAYQWWIDTRNCRDDVAPTEYNIWDDWVI